MKKYKKYILVLILIGFLVYANALGNEFVWDDEEMVVKNAPLFQLNNIPSLFTQATFYSGGSQLSGWFYRPLVMGTFLLTKVIFGLHPFGFHLVQVTLHLINGVLIFFVFRKIFNFINKGNRELFAFALALVFVVHPAGVEAVAYVASVAEPLYTIFLLVIFILMLNSEKKKPDIKHGRITAFLFLLALLTKEGAIVFLPISLLYVYLLQRKDFNFWVKYLGGGLISYIFIRLIFFGIQTQRPNFINPVGQATFIERLQTLPFILFSFLRTFFFPKDLSVSQHTVVRSLDISNFFLPLTSVSIFLVFSVWYLIKTKKKIASFWFLWALISIVPVTNVFIALDMTFAERWLYFPLIGFLGFIGAILSSLQEKKTILIVIFILIATAFLSVRTVLRNRDWRNGFTLYSHDIKNQPESYDLQNNFGVELFRHGKIKEALEHFERSVDLQPHWTISNNNLGATYEELGDLKKAESYYHISIRLGDYYLAYENYVGILVKQEKFEEAIEFLEGEALRKFPENKKLLKLYYYLRQKST